MASITCAHCRKTHTSVAAVRACAYRDTPFASVTAAMARRSVGLATMPLAAGHVVTLHASPGKYWEVTDTGRLSDGTPYLVNLISQGPAQARWIGAEEVERQWSSLNAAAGELISETERHSSTADQQGYVTDTHNGPLVKSYGSTSAPWDQVNAQRAAVKEHLVREERGKRVGYFALLVEENGADVVKFYRVRTGRTGGKWANHLFVDAQASDDFYPVRAQDTLVAVLEGILADPEAAGLLYATELGRCCRCRRTLTDETSRRLGIGPECRKRG